MVSRKDSRVFGGILLIAGTSIGAAMLAMPILTGLFGFFGTFAIMVACWLFMYWTATLILEASLQFEDGVSFITMAQRALGPVGAVITWITFLLFFYSLIAAYLKGSGHLVVDTLDGIFHINLPPFVEIFPLLILFAPFLYFGLAVVDGLNRYLMVAMLITYTAMTLWLLPDVSIERLLYTNWSFSLLSFSVVITSFGYHVLIPSLVTYLDRDVERIKRCLFIGSFIPLVIYFIWELSILGSLPVQGSHGLAHAFKADIPLAKLLRMQTHSDIMAALARSFSIFAIVTSFLGVAQGLFDFLKDGIHASHSHSKRLGAFLLTFLPPVFFIICFEGGFIALLDYAGALVSIILGIIPIAIVWRLRKARGPFPYQAKGGPWALFLGCTFFIFVVILVILKNFQILRFNVDSLL
jgi:tyrosine-specific transport protein